MQSLLSAVPTIYEGGTTATVTDPAGNVSTHSSAGNMALTYSPGAYLPFYKTEDQYYSGSSTLLKSVVYGYSDSNTGCISTTGPWLLEPCDITTTYNAGNSTLSSKVAMTYHYNNPTQIKEYDYSGTLLKTTSAIWESGGIYSDGMTFNTSTNVESGPVGVTTLADMIDHLQSLTITDAVTGLSNTKAFTYDAKGNLQQSSVSGTGVSTLTTSYTPLDSYGMPTQAQDPKGNVTKYSYTDSWSDNTCAPSSNSQAYLTSVTNPLSQTTTYEWDSCTGALGSVTDPNGQITGKTTSFVYDELGRTTQVSYPDGGGAQAAYTDTVPNSIQISKLQSTGHSVVSSTVLDGFARTIQSQLVSDPTGKDYTDTTYDALGRVASTSNPYRSGAVSNTFFFYDALGRKTLQTQPDGAQLEWCYDDINDPQHPASNCHPNGTSYAGTWVDSLDEAGNDTQRAYDSDSRLRGVLEADSAKTSYGYDGVGNLLNVSQTGVSGDTARGRSFVYDSLSRLTSAANPETGTVLYSYPNSGSLCAGDLSLPCSKTDARGVATNYSYDAINRPLSKTYSGTATSTLATQYTYDNAAITNGIGRLATEYTGSASAPTTKTTVLSYDPMGRVTEEATVAPNASATVFANYDLAGNQISLTYPDGRVVQHFYELAGRPQNVTYALWNTTNVNQSYFAETNGYDAAGHLLTGTFGNGVAYTAGNYDNRERMTTLTYGPLSAPAWSKQFAWTKNSNLQSQTDLITGIQRQFNYDSLNRLTVAQDIFSNLAVSSGSNDHTGSTSSSGSGAAEPPGDTGALPEWTDPDDSNLLTDIGASNSTWIKQNAVVAPNAAVAPDGSMTATTVTATSGSTDTFVQDSPTSAADYSLETMSGSVWLRSISGNQSINLYITTDYPGGYTVAGMKSLTLTPTWQQYHLAAAVPDNATAVLWEIGGGGSVQAGGGFYMWNPMLEDQGIAGSSVTNFLPYSQRFTTSNWLTTSATVADNVLIAPDQTTTGASMTGNSISNSVQNPAPFDGQQVTASVWLKASTPQQAVVALTETNSGTKSTIVSQVVSVTTFWTRFHVTGTAASALSQLSLQIGGNPTIANSTPVNIWGAQLELASSAGPYVATADVPVTAGTTLTNLLTYSQQPTGPSWLPGSVAVSANTVKAPDGSMTAAKITATQAQSDFIDLAPNPDLYDGAQLTGSVYLKSDTGSGATINLYIYTVNASGTQYFTPQTVSLTPTWQRYSITGVVPVGLTGLALQIGGGTSFTTNQTFDMWGAQIEVAPHAGPYIATSALPIITGSELINILPNSQSISGANWGATGTITVGATAPDNSATAATFKGTNGSAGPPATGDNWVQAYVPNPSLYDSETVTASVYLSVASGTQSVNLSLNGAGDHGAQTVASSTASLTTTWQRFDLTGPLDNGLTAVTLQIGGGGSLVYNKSIQIWGAQFVVGSVPAPYDPTSATTTVYATGQPGTPVPIGLSQVYSYDSFGNITQNGSFETLYTANNQMFGYAYDASGNLLSDQISDNMTWDAESRMSTVGGATYIYDAEGNRVEKQGSSVMDTIFFGGQPIARYTGGQWTDLISGPTGLLAEVPGTQASPAVYRVTDNLGTNVGSLLANGSFVDPVDHTPFGQVFIGNTSDPYLFTGKERDAESGLDYFGARYYASNMGRMMSPDWSAKAEPVPYAKLDNPQTLNLYAYVGNNPLSRTDPTGHYEFRNSGCADNAKCQKKWDKRQDKFENRREKDLKSKKADVRAAAAAYGARGEANGVHVGFADSKGAYNGVTNPFSSTPGNVDIEVTIDNSRVGSDTQEHEGAHVADNFKFLNSYDPAKGGYDQSLNITHGQTEFNGLKVGAEIDGGHGLNPNNPQGIWDFIRNSPVYGPVMNNPVFPPALFPGPTGPED